jgi:hypothetical protein
MFIQPRWNIETFARLPVLQGFLLFCGQLGNQLLDAL